MEEEGKGVLVGLDSGEERGKEFSFYELGIFVMECQK
jgi:hypothetical protein